MSTHDPQTLRRELLVQQELDRRLDPLVQRANKAAARLKNSERMEKSQLRNLLNVAVESRSVEVVVNFIRYQIARSEAWGRGPNDFGHRVIDDIRTEMKRLAAEATNEVQRQLGAEAQPSDTAARELEGEIYIRMVQLYLGYLNRAFYYGKETKNFDQLEEFANGR